MDSIVAIEEDVTAEELQVISCWLYLLINLNANNHELFYFIVCSSYICLFTNCVLFFVNKFNNEPGTFVLCTANHYA